MSHFRDPDGEPRRLHHWWGITGATLLVAAIGIIDQEPRVILIALVGVVFAAYARTAQPTPIEASDLQIDHTFSDDSPEPGDEVDIVLTVANEGSRLVPELQIVDGVPPDLDVIDGSTSQAAALRPGERSGFEYTVRAVRGRFEWEPPTVTVTDLRGEIERELAVSIDAKLDCAFSADSGTPDEVPLYALASLYPGRIGIDRGGEGTEFYGIREYRPADPLSRINWHHWAKRREFATVEFRQERMARVMLVVDTRRSAYLHPAPGTTHAVDRSVRAAHQVFDALLDAGDMAGIATFGQRGEDYWLTPGSGAAHRARGRDALANDPAFSTTPPEYSLYEYFPSDRTAELKAERIRRLHARLLPDTQVILCSPCCDDYVPSIARTLHAGGHPVTVLSPDPTANDEPLHAIARLGRQSRLAGLRDRHIRVIDWPHGEPFVAHLQQADAGGQA